MKRIWLLIALVLLAVLAIPIPRSVEDGGTRVYTALTYRIVDWKINTDDGVFEETDVYWFPDNFTSMDDLVDAKAETVPHSFTATVVELGENWVLVEPVEGEWERRSSDRICIGIEDLTEIDVQTGSYVKLTYTGGIMESYPARIRTTDWELATDLRHVTYQGAFVDTEAAETYDTAIFTDIVITKIYADCFFARTVIPMPYEIKLNGTLSADWCVGDQVAVTYENTLYDQASQRVEADLLTIKPSTFTPQPGVYYKPVIYLYPEEETAVSVALDIDGKLTCTYPAYREGWTVTAMPDGTLLDADGQSYNYLYWEGETNTKWDTAEGFCVPGEGTAAFLEQALADLGLSRREANEFIVYWLPLMEQNPYNIICFQEAAYTQAAKLQVSPTPDTVIRVFMTWQPSDQFVTIPAQTLTAPEREGFTVVEWGGTQLTD